MNFRIYLRHSTSGLERAFNDRQEIADFFVTHPRADYEGWQNLGKLPAPTALAVQEAIEGGDTVLEGAEDGVPQLEPDPAAPHNEDAAFPTEVPTSAQNPLGLASVAEAQASGVVSEIVAPDGAENVKAVEPTTEVETPVVTTGSAEPAAVDPDATLPGILAPEGAEGAQPETASTFVQDPQS